MNFKNLESLKSIRYKANFRVSWQTWILSTAEHCRPGNSNTYGRENVIFTCGSCGQSPETTKLLFLWRNTWNVHQKKPSNAVEWTLFLRINVFQFSFFYFRILISLRPTSSSKDYSACVNDSLVVSEVFCLPSNYRKDVPPPSKTCLNCKVTLFCASHLSRGTHAE